MRSRPIVMAGGMSLVIGAVSFVAVFSYLAANFEYPAVLEGTAAEVLPRLQRGGATMRVVWALYAFLPLLLVPGAVATYIACTRSRDRMTLALVSASLGALAMCLGLMRWPSVHWMLAEAYVSGSADVQAGVAAMFRGLNLYLGVYIGEFLGELCLGLFFALTGWSLRVEPGVPKWVGAAGQVFAVLFLIGALRNVTSAVQPIADLNNLLLPLWLLVQGGVLFWLPDREGRQGSL